MNEHAVRARTILAGSTSVAVTVETEGAVGTPQDASASAWSQRPLALCADPFPAGCRTVAVEVEVADAAPLPVRDRIRGRVRLSGRTPAERGCAALHVSSRTVTLEEDGRSVPIDVEDLLATEPDPLHTVEAPMLGHLESAHGDVVGRLTTLVEARHRLGVVRVWPYRLDRHGLVLRFERASGHTDHRLPFRAPLASPDALAHEMALLIAGAGRPCARTPRSGGALEPVLRAAPAAHRLCSPEHDDPTS